MDYAIEQGEYQILKVKDKKTKKEIWIKEHCFNEDFHAKIKGETPKSKHYLEQLYDETAKDGESEDEEEVEDEEETEEDEEEEKETEEEDEKIEEEDTRGKTEEQAGYASMKKTDLIVVAQQKGLTVDPLMTKSKIIAMLEKA